MEASGGSSSSESKQRLLPWIQAQIEGGQIEGLHWLNEEKTLFQIPWTHKGKQEWNEESGKIFMEYEKHTGRYQDGSVKPLDYAKSKTRLRCALHKSLDFRMVEDPQMTNENVRVYEVLRRTSTRQPNYQQSGSPFAGQSNAATPSVGGDVQDLNLGVP